MNKTKKLVDGFVHRPGVHCESSAVRDVFEYYGLKLSEEIVFGLDGTFGFVYWKQKSMIPPVHIGGKISMFPNWLPRLVGIKVEKKTTSSPKKAWQVTKNLIDNNIPVLIHADIYYLDYLQIPKELWNHFGAHMIVIVGYDDDKQETYCADTNFERLQTVSIASLVEARNSKYRPFPPRNAWFEVGLPKKTQPLDSAVKTAIRETADLFLNPPRKNFGIKGINYLADEIKNWSRLWPESEFKLTSLLAYVDMEEAGTGGGNFRRLYSRFLKEAGESSHEEKLKRAANELQKSADGWTKIAHLLLSVSKEQDADKIRESLSTAHQKIIECAEVEEQVFTSLKSLT